MHTVRLRIDPLSLGVACLCSPPLSSPPTTEFRFLQQVMPCASSLEATRRRSSFLPQPVAAAGA